MAAPQRSPNLGGGGGNPFDDNQLGKKIVGVTGFTIRHGNQVDGVQFTYLLADNTTFQAPYHGGSGGSATTVNLAVGEVIVQVSGKSSGVTGVLVDQLIFVTKKRDGSSQSYGPYGQTGDIWFNISGLIAAVFGRSGTKLDGIGFYYY